MTRVASDRCFAGVMPIVTVQSLLLQKRAAFDERYWSVLRPATSAGPLGGGLVLTVIYLPGMSSGAEASRYGEVFNEVAEAYERYRPTYPDALIDRAREVGGLGPGATVLEIGCGTGQLTRSLLARGLRVTALEPGKRLISRARDQLGSAGDVQFVNRRLEEASLPRAHYSAVFSASAIHWIDVEDVFLVQAMLVVPQSELRSLSSWRWLRSCDRFGDISIVRPLAAVAGAELQHRQRQPGSA